MTVSEGPTGPAETLRSPQGSATDDMAVGAPSGASGGPDPTPAGPAVDAPAGPPAPATESGEAAAERSGSGAAPPSPPLVARPWFGYASLALSVLLGLVVLAQSMQLSTLYDRTERLTLDAARAERSYERRLSQLEDRADALTERVRHSLDSAAVAEHVLPSVFRVVAGNSSGTAFAVGRTSDGGTYLVTNEHVVGEVPEGGKVRLLRDGRSQFATVVKTSVIRDVAVLQTSAEIPVLRLATEPPVPGEPVVVIGAPVGLEDTVTTGVVSKTRPIDERRQEYIQFDAAINPGNSGGPVVDADGRVVGIATAKAMDAEGIGFALPIGVACDSFDFIC